MTTPTPRDIELATEAFGRAMLRSFHEEAIMVIARTIALARAEERERCCKRMCVYCELGWPIEGMFHKNPGGEFADLPEWCSCAADGLRANTQGAPDAKPE